MSITLYNSCIEELEKPSNKQRKIDIISGYLYSLKNFMLLVRGKKENSKNILDKISSVMKLRKTKKYEIIVTEDDKGKDFFILLKGVISVLTPKINEYYMSKEEYISFLFQLRLKDQNELISKCLSLNQNIYPINEDNFDIFVYNLSLGKTLDESYSKDINLMKKAKSVYQYISEEKKNLEKLNKKNDKKENIFSPENYIIQNSVPELVVKNTELIENYINKLELGSLNSKEEKKEEDSGNKIDEEGKILLSNRKKVFIPSHEIFGDLESGSYFGETALEEKPFGKRQATLIALEDCKIGIIDKNNYFLFLHNYIEKAQNKYLSFISTFYIFKNLSQTVWEKRYISLFINKVFEKDYLLLKEGKKIDQIYFIYKGEFEITANKNLIEVNELIIYYKKILFELLSKDKKNNKEMIKFCDIKEEIKENDNFLMNKKFEEEKMKKLISKKKTIKLGIFSSKEMLGLLDLYSKIPLNENNSEREIDNFRIKKFEMTSLFNCKCISCNCEVYTFPLIKFMYMRNNEDKVDELTNKLEIKKINLMIKRLIHYKDFIFESMYLKEKETKNEIKIIKNKYLHRGKKNKFEPNFEYSNLKIKNGIISNINNINRNKNYKKWIVAKSYSNYIFSNSNDKNRNRNKFKISNAVTQKNYRFLKNNEKLKIKKKILGMPIIDDVGKSNQKLLRLKTEIDIKSYNHKSRIIFPASKEENQNSGYKNRNNFLENNKINKNNLTDNENIFEKDIFCSHTNNLKNSFLNADKTSINFFSKKPLIKKHNWVAQVLVNNLVYNHFFDKCAFSSSKNSRNNYNCTKYTFNNHLKSLEERDNLNINENNPKNNESFIKQKEKSLCKNEINNKIEPNFILSKINKSLSSISEINKIKDLKIKSNIGNKKEKIINKSNVQNNRIYDALIYENFNKFFNERVYKQFLDD